MPLISGSEKNDPYYTAKGRAKELQYPYLTPDQEVRRRRTEIPISAIAGRIENSTGDIRDDADLMDYLDNRNVFMWVTFPRFLAQVYREGDIFVS